MGFVSGLADRVDVLTVCQAAGNMLAYSTIVNAIATVALLSTSATALAVPVLGSPAKALEARAISPISVQDACVAFYGEQVTAQTIGNGCNDWLCLNKSGTRLSVYMDQWCRSSTGRVAHAECRGAVYDWVCVN